MTNQIDYLTDKDYGMAFISIAYGIDNLTDIRNNFIEHKIKTRRNKIISAGGLKNQLEILEKNNIIKRKKDKRHVKYTINYKHIIQKDIHKICKEYNEFIKKSEEAQKKYNTKEKTINESGSKFYKLINFEELSHNKIFIELIKWFLENRFNSSIISTHYVNKEGYIGYLKDFLNFFQEVLMTRIIDKHQKHFDKCTKNPTKKQKLKDIDFIYLIIFLRRHYMEKLSGLNVCGVEISREKIEIKILG